MNKHFETPSKTSPKGGRRGCLCKNNTYSTKCCDGTLSAQGIGQTSSIGEVITFLAQENGNLILQEDNQKIKI
tara:strand:+ start:2945 stop:3163 length:219 start_codon:yes stop_codon:yes gene_type:complete